MAGAFVSEFAPIMCAFLLLLLPLPTGMHLLPTQWPLIGSSAVRGEPKRSDPSIVADSHSRVRVGLCSLVVTSELDQHIVSLPPIVERAAA